MTSNFLVAAGAPKAAFRRIATGIGLLVALTTFSATASAQDPFADPSANPFGAPGGNQPAGQPSTRPPAVTPSATADQADAAPPGPPPIDLTQYGPAIRLVLDRDPTTPAELLEGIVLLVELGEPELARPWLDALVQAPPDAQAAAALARQIGSHRIMRLASADALGDEARELANSLMEAYAADVRDPARLGRLIEQLADPAVEVRYAAVAGLVEAGDAGAAALVAALDEAQSEEHAQWMQIALAELAPASLGPLLAGLQSESEPVRAGSAAVLGAVAPGHLGHRLLAASLIDESPRVRGAAEQAVNRVLGQRATREAAERVLRDSVQRHLEGDRPLATPAEGRVEVWYWDPAAEAPAAVELEPEQARVYLASRLAHDLVRIAPASPEYRTWNTMLQLAVAALGLPSDHDPGEMDLGLRRQITMAALDEALRRDLPRGIIGAAREVSTMPDGDAVLLSRAPEESPLVRALAYPDPTVRWEALAAIMRLDPRSPYPGASRVTQALADAVQSGGRPRAVVALPRTRDAQNLGAALDKLGYTVSLATSGRQAIRAAAESGGAELVLIDARISRPPLREVLYQIRANPISSGAAIGVLGVGRSLDSARETAADHPGVLAFPHPLAVAGEGEMVLTAAVEQPVPPPLHAPSEQGIPIDPRVVLDEAAVEQILGRLNGGRGDVAAVGVPTRTARAAQALAWLGELLARGETFYNVRKLEPVVLETVNHAELVEAAVGILAHFGSQESQLRLVNLASAGGAPIELRNRAAEAFRASVRRYGLQLTSGEILRQYDRYNASETANRETQLVLGHVLDTIEM